MSHLYLQYESPGSPPPPNPLRTAAADAGLAVVTHSLISNGVCLLMSSQTDVKLAKTPSLTSGDLGGDVGGGDRDLCREDKKKRPNV